MAPTLSLYQYLNLPSSATQEAIDEAYQQAILQWSDNPDGLGHLTYVQLAYSILSKPMRRAGYDTYGLESILDHDTQYREETPPLAPQSTPPVASSRTIAPSAYRPIPKLPKSVAFHLTQEQEKERRRREIRRMSEPEEERRRHKGSSSKSTSKSKDKKMDRERQSKDATHKGGSKDRSRQKAKPALLHPVIPTEKPH